MSHAPLSWCGVHFQMRTYPSHFPPKCNALLCVLYDALCSPAFRIRQYCRRLFDASKSRNVPSPNVLVPSSSLPNRSQRIFSTSRRAHLPLCNRLLQFHAGSSSVGHRDPFHRSLGTAAALASSKTMRPNFEPIIHGELSSKACTDAFDPEKHLAFVPPSTIYTMKDLNLDDIGVSPIAVSDPFPLFSPEAIQSMRAEVLSDRVWDNCQYSSNLAQCQLRGFAPEYVIPVSA